MSQGRALMTGETNLARSIFRDSVDYGKVKIHPAKYVFFQPDNSGMTPNGEIYIAGQAYKDNYSTEDSGWQCFFIHEMTHVWQYQNRVLRVKTSALWENLRHGFRYDRAYYYTLRLEKDLRDYGLEQQAAIIVDYLRVTKFGEDFHRDARGNLRVQNPPDDREELLISVMRRFLADPHLAN
jgi:hypothetical protein